MSGVPSSHVFVQREIGLWIRDLVYTHLRGASELGLKECRYGDLTKVPIASLGDRIPAVLVMPTGFGNAWAEMGGSDYLTHYFYRVAWIALVPQGADVESERAKGDRISDLISNNVHMRNPTVPATPNGEGLNVIVSRSDLRCPENEEAQAVSSDYYAVAYDVDVYWHGFNLNVSV